MILNNLRLVKFSVARRPQEREEERQWASLAHAGKSEEAEEEESDIQDT